MHNCMICLSETDQNMSWVLTILTNYYVLLKTKGEVRLEGNVDQVVKDQHKGMYNWYYLYTSPIGYGKMQY